MEPLQLAAAAVGFLVPFFKQAAGKLAEQTGETIADAVLPKVQALYERVRAKLAPGSYEGALLDGVRSEPSNAGRQEILKAELAKVITEDSEFAAELKRMVDEAEKAVGPRIMATDAGVVAGGYVQQRGRYVAGRDMTIGSQPREQQ